MLFTCSCATNKPASLQFPREVSMNQDAGCGGLLKISIRLGYGGTVPFILDTGNPLTMVDQSFGPKLGNRLGSVTLKNFGFEQEATTYAAPPLYLGNVRLEKSGQYGPYIIAYDRNQLESLWKYSASGILGMDVLRNYCIQLDFAARKVRFLDGSQADKSGWGRPIPLGDIGDGCPAIHENFTGVTGIGTEIDTGCSYDGWLTPKLFEQWTNHPQTSMRGMMISTNGVLGGETYGQLDLLRVSDQAAASDDPKMKCCGVGLRVLSQNLVTLDFPNHTMYLKRTNPDKLEDNATVDAATRAGESALKYLMRLKNENQLPGWSKSDERAGDSTHIYFTLPGMVTFDRLQKKGDSSLYHYVVNRPSKHEPWHLQKAWRADQNDKLLETYVTP